MKLPVEVFIDALMWAEAHRDIGPSIGPPKDSWEWAMIRANVVFSALSEAGYELDFEPPLQEAA